MNAKNVALSGLRDVSYRVLRTVIGMPLIFNVLIFAFLSYAGYKQTGFGLAYWETAVAFGAFAASLFALDAALKWRGYKQRIVAGGLLVGVGALFMLTSPPTPVMTWYTVWLDWSSVALGVLLSLSGLQSLHGDAKSIDSARVQ